MASICRFDVQIPHPTSNTGAVSPKPYAYFEPITINLLVITILIIDFILTF
jgi:hypothetical protein